jgi:hypothetical protein
MVGKPWSSVHVTQVYIPGDSLAMREHTTVVVTRGYQRAYVHVAVRFLILCRRNVRALKQPCLDKSSGSGIGLFRRDLPIA